MKILIIDDQRVHTTFIKLMLREVKEAEVFSSDNVFDGYAILKAMGDIDLLLLDNNMPFVKGMDFYHFLRNQSNFKELPIIFSSADDIDVTGMSNVKLVQKPFTKDSLLAAIDFDSSSKSFYNL